MKSTTSTSENLPTTTHDDNIAPPPVCDVDGDPLKTGENYIIKIPHMGFVYWGKIGNTPCPNTVFVHNSAQGNVENVRAVKFFFPNNATTGLQVNVDSFINIMFSVDQPDPCAKESVWKVDENKYVVTGTLESKSNVFKIQINGSEIQGYENVYKLTYCSPYVTYEYVSTVKDNGKIRLVISPTVAPPIVFAKAKNA